MFVYTAVNPVPPVNCRVLRIRHIRAGVETPGRIGQGANRSTVAEQRPDSLRPVGVAWMVLLLTYI